MAGEPTDYVFADNRNLSQIAGAINWYTVLHTSIRLGRDPFQ